MGDEKKGLYHILYGYLDDTGHIDDFAGRGIYDVKKFLYNVLRGVPIDMLETTLKSGTIGYWAA